jgi:hypothetical protein
MKYINNEQDTAQKRKLTFKKEIEEQSALEKSPKKLLKMLEEEDYGAEINAMWHQGNGDRQMWLTRQQAFLDEYDEFLDPIVEAPAAWAADLHLPVALSIGKTFHARFYAAVMGQEPICNVKARKAANEERSTLIQDLMHYTLKNWTNDYSGIDSEMDTFIWRWCMRGNAIFKMGWEKKYSKIIDVVKKQVPTIQYVTNPETGAEEAIEVIQEVEVEEEVIQEDCNAPRISAIAPEDLLIIGGKGDVDQADAVLEQCFMTASELWTLVDQGIFDAEAVKEVILAGENMQSGAENNGIKQMQVEKSGEASLDKHYDLKKYQIIEAYVKKDVFDSGINSDIVVWVHGQSGRILRATFLHRINKKTKKRPYAKADFYVREGQTYGIGLIELTYSLCKEIDALNNMAMDFGLLSSIPFGYFRASSNISTESLPIEPGSLIPVDDPSSILFPNLGARHAFPMQHLQFLYSVIERLTGINDLNMGVIGGQGVTRTASGVSALMSESNANLDIFLRRLNRAIKKVFKYTFALVQEKMPVGMEFRILGDNGQNYFRQLKSREEISGEFDFELEPSSANSNPGIRQQTAMAIMQMTGNMLDFQLGIITPLQRYESLKNYLISMQVKDYGRYLQKPAQQMRIYTPEELANRVLSGVDTMLTPEQDLQGFAAYVDQIINDDELMGQFQPDQAIALVKKQQEAMAMMQAMKQMQGQQANITQQKANAAGSANQTIQQAAPGTVGNGMQPTEGM